MQHNKNNQYNRITKFSKVETMGLGLEARTRARNYREIIGIPRSIYYQSKFIDITPRSIGMPTTSGQNFFTRLETPSQLQISSSSVNDNGTGTTGAITIYIDGLVYNNGKWKQKSTFSTPTTLNGQNAVLIDNDNDWYRINKIWVITTGSSNFNEGNLYISPFGTTLTAGVPNSNILAAVIENYSNSTGGFFSIPYGTQFLYTRGNFWVATNKEIRFEERFYQDFNGSGITSNMSRYEVGAYPGDAVSYNYDGAAPYTGLTDIEMNVYTLQGNASAATMYVEYVLIDESKINN